MRRNAIILTVLGLSAAVLSTAHSSSLALNERFEDSHRDNLNALNDSPAERLHQPFAEAQQETLNS